MICFNVGLTLISRIYNSAGIFRKNFSFYPFIVFHWRVTFCAKDYRQGGKRYQLKLSDAEFIRRFAQHILPKGFTRIRHYGILSSSLKKVILPQIEQQIGKVILPAREESKHMQCPVCRIGRLVTIFTFNSRGPPPETNLILKLAACKM